MRKKVTLEWLEFLTSTCVEGQNKVDEAIRFASPQAENEKKTSITGQDVPTKV